MITAQDLDEAINVLYKQYQRTNEFVYFLPSPNPGKRLMIKGLIAPDEAALMVYNVWRGTKTIEDYPCMTEIDII